MLLWPRKASRLVIACVCNRKQKLIQEGESQGCRDGMPVMLTMEHQVLTTRVFWESGKINAYIDSAFSVTSLTTLTKCLPPGLKAVE
jgi:hypothetical protein